MDDLKKNNNAAEDTKVTRLPLTSDYVFKRIFAREENNSMLKDFLEAILNIHINKVEVKNPELTPNMADEKLGILDLKLDIDNERVVDVEMQVSNEHNIKERSSTYLSKLAAEQLKAKQNYKELKKIITINILKYNYLERNSYHSIARMKYDDTNPIEFVDMGYKQEEKEVKIDGTTGQELVPQEENNEMDAVMQTNKMMSWMMPIMSISIAFVAPLGLALYWLVSNILMIAERLILDKIIK